jgi:hypothetical protein
MKLIAIHTINRGGKLGMAAPGDAFDASEEDGKALIAAGAAVRKTRQIADNDDGDADQKLPLAEIIAMADQQGVKLPAFKQAAAFYLATVPDTREEILAALKALPPETPV